MDADKARDASSDAANDEVADRLHSLAIRLLRKVRRNDEESGVTAPHLSALSVLVFGGPRTIGELATAEQVRAPSMTRIVDNLERDGLAARERDSADGRIVLVRATDAGAHVMREGRSRRVRALSKSLAALTDVEMDAIRAATLAIMRALAIDDATTE
jgi:DNA-binding MarR family transcriptional regulator